MKHIKSWGSFPSGWSNRDWIYHPDWENINHQTKLSPIAAPAYCLEKALSLQCGKGEPWQSPAVSLRWENRASEEFAGQGTENEEAAQRENWRWAEYSAEYWASHASLAGKETAGRRRHNPKAHKMLRIVFIPAGQGKNPHNSGSIRVLRRIFLSNGKKIIFDLILLWAHWTKFKSKS